MGGTFAVSSWLSRSTYSRIEFRSLSMRTRSSAVSSRFASSATCRTSDSVTFMGKKLQVRVSSFKGNRRETGNSKPVHGSRLSPDHLRLDPGPQLFRQNKVDAADVMAGELVDGGHILRGQTQQLSAPGGIGNLHSQDSIIDVQSLGFIGYGGAANQRPRQYGGIIGGGPA